MLQVNSANPQETVSEGSATTLQPRHSFVWRMIVPVPLAVVVAIVAIWAVIPGVVTSNAVDQAVRAGRQIAAQFKTIRGYYTDNVVAKIVKDGTLKPSMDHKASDKAIPLPATMIHDLSKLLSKEDITVSLYSAYPFPNRKERVLDAFQREAWDFLAKNPQASFSRKELRDGKDVVRVAVADTMVAPGCVNCHNTIAGSPKTDWKLGDVRGVLEVTSAIDAQLADGAVLSRKIIIGAGLIGLLLLCITLVVTRSVAKPVGHLVGAMDKLATGDTSVAIPGEGRRDEIGGMAKALHFFKDKMIEAERLRMAQEEQKQQADARRRDEVLHMAADFEEAVSSIIEAVSTSSTELEASAAALSKTAETTGRMSTGVAAASEEASAHVQSVAVATEEMAVSVAEIGRRVRESSKIAEEAVGQAEKTDSRILKLSQSASRIGDVTKLITTIAEQTNLLALNATIEAARAGDAGRGFAVVAQEVKTLAAQTAKATGEISSQIAEMQSATQDSVVAIKEIAGTIGRISEIAASIASAVEQQGASTEGIARSVQQAAAGTSRVASNIVDVNRGAADTGSASSQVLSSAQSLTNESNRLKLEMQNFLSTIRAA